MNRLFINTKVFDKHWSELGLTDSDLIELQRILTDDPHAGDVIQGTNGIRKLRLALPHKGKRGSTRVLYVDFAVYERIYLLLIYPKNKVSDISEKEKAGLTKMVNALRETLEGKI